MSRKSYKPILFKGEMVRAILEGRKSQTRRLIKHSAAFKDYPDGLTKEEIKERRNAPLTIPAGDEERCIEYLTKNCRFKVGQVLWVRETWTICDCREGPDDADCESEDEVDDYHNILDVAYKADDVDSQRPLPTHEVRMLDSKSRNFMDRYDEACVMGGDEWWLPSIHMPRNAARVFLKVKSVRVERLQDISTADAIAEGIDSTEIIVNGTSQGMAYRDYHLLDDPCEWYSKPVDSYRSLWDKINGRGNFKSNPWVYVIEFEHLRDFKNPFQ